MNSVYKLMFRDLVGVQVANAFPSLDREADSTFALLFVPTALTHGTVHVSMQHRREKLKRNALSSNQYAWTKQVVGARCNNNTLIADPFLKK